MTAHTAFLRSKQPRQGGEWSLVYATGLAGWYRATKMKHDEKKMEWKRRRPPREVTEEVARELNKRADEECTRVLDCLMGGKMGNDLRRRQRAAPLEAAEQWAGQALKHAEEVWGVYSLWLRRKTGCSSVLLQRASDIVKEFDHVQIDQGEEVEQEESDCNVFG